jgi:type 1 fimbria pilin
MSKYVVVNAGSNQPIFAIGLCCCHTDKTEAEKAAASWNGSKTPSKCTAKVIEIKEGGTQ